MCIQLLKGEQMGRWGYVCGLRTSALSAWSRLSLAPAPPCVANVAKEDRVL
jgi:hypothetical protein